MIKHLLVAGMVVLPGFAAAQQLVTVSGSCDRLVVGAKAFTPLCKGIAINTVYDSGRVGFIFTIASEALVTFSGMDMANPTPDTDRTMLDRVIFFKLGKAGEPPSVTKVTGNCDYGNPYKGKMTIDCEAAGADGSKYSVQFRTDGNPPH
jgi:hypothetical protein